MIQNNKQINLNQKRLEQLESHSEYSSEDSDEQQSYFQMPMLKKYQPQNQQEDDIWRNLSQQKQQVQNFKNANNFNDNSYYQQSSQKQYEQQNQQQQSGLQSNDNQYLNQNQNLNNKSENDQKRYNKNQEEQKYKRRVSFSNQQSEQFSMSPRKKNSAQIEEKRQAIKQRASIKEYKQMLLNQGSIESNKGQNQKEQTQTKLQNDLGESCQISDSVKSLQNKNRSISFQSNERFRGISKDYTNKLKRKQKGSVDNYDIDKPIQLQNQENYNKPQDIQKSQSYSGLKSLNNLNSLNKINIQQIVPIKYCRSSTSSNQQQQNSNNNSNKQSSQLNLQNSKQKGYYKYQHNSLGEANDNKNLEKIESFSNIQNNDLGSSQTFMENNNKNNYQMQIKENNLNKQQQYQQKQQQTYSNTQILKPNELFSLKEEIQQENNYINEDNQKAVNEFLNELGYQKEIDQIEQLQNVAIERDIINKNVEMEKILQKIKELEQIISKQKIKIRNPEYYEQLKVSIEDEKNKLLLNKKIEKLDQRVKELENALETEQMQRKQLEEQVDKYTKEYEILLQDANSAKKEVFEQLEIIKEKRQTLEEMQQKLEQQQQIYEKRLSTGFDQNQNNKLGPILCASQIGNSKIKNKIIFNTGNKKSTLQINSFEGENKIQNQFLPVHSLFDLEEEIKQKRKQINKIEEKPTDEQLQNNNNQLTNINQSSNQDFLISSDNNQNTEEKPIKGISEEVKKTLILTAKSKFKDTSDEESLISSQNLKMNIQNQNNEQLNQNRQQIIKNKFQNDQETVVSNYSQQNENSSLAQFRTGFKKSGTQILDQKNLQLEKKNRKFSYFNLGQMEESEYNLLKKQSSNQYNEKQSKESNSIQQETDYFKELQQLQNEIIGNNTKQDIVGDFTNFILSDQKNFNNNSVSYFNDQVLQNSKELNQKNNQNQQKNQQTNQNHIQQISQNNLINNDQNNDKRQSLMRSSRSAINLNNSQQLQTLNNQQINKISKGARQSLLFINKETQQFSILNNQNQVEDVNEDQFSQTIQQQLLSNNKDQNKNNIFISNSKQSLNQNDNIDDIQTKNKFNEYIFGVNEKENEIENKSKSEQQLNKQYSDKIMNQNINDEDDQQQLIQQQNQLYDNNNNELKLNQKDKQAWFNSSLKLRQQFILSQQEELQNSSNKKKLDNSAQKIQNMLEKLKNSQHKINLLKKK
ncbi:hypothetical protein PPERSA_06385 [Pseudocohnilembus persalinus]|uniref:Uncharacterized protein n=1 Tax=Pseudocohnilembus persalinus TaxID=266149 RepID=A0A0V0QJ08_PSEPJ|nr:hypothetical protein PPERSA_06385 [Pseudocohnilembus persalinus]|eukprot:KRX02190.1 hypothetical protein PPERSA_06385 [Pseudocohnilembus persalinus]